MIVRVLKWSVDKRLCPWYSRTSFDTFASRHAEGVSVFVFCGRHLMDRKIGAAVLTLLLTIPSASLAQSAAPTPVPDVKPDLSPMAMFMGTWSCTVLKSPDGRTT